MGDIRHCFSCNKEIKIFSYYMMTHLSLYKRRFGSKLMIEIWDNPIFVINCCDCHSKINIGRVLRKRLEQRPHKCTECGDGIIKAGLCYSCYFKKKEGNL